MRKAKNSLSLAALVPRRHFAILASTLLAPSTLFAATAVWDGGGGADHTWQNPLNWGPDVVPTSTTDVIFSNGVAPNLVIEAGGSATAANSITISTITSFTVHSSTFGMTLTSGSLTRQDVAGTEGVQKLDVFMSLGNDATWNVAGSGSLTV